MTDNLKKLLESISLRGYKAYIVGGYTRDYFMCNDKANHDVDITTDAPVNVLLEIFSEFKPNVLKYDTLNFTYNDYHIDIAHFREEKLVDNVLDVTFTDSLYIDSLRRDFTINAIYIDENEHVFDFHDGLNHAKCKMLKFIGDVEKRLDEDPTRLLRYIFFLLKYNLSYDNDEYLFLKENLSKYLPLCSSESINKYMIKIVNSCNLNYLIDKLKSIGIYDHLFAEDTVAHFNNVPEFFFKAKYKYYNELPKKYKL